MVLTLTPTPEALKPTPEAFCSDKMMELDDVVRVAVVVLAALLEEGDLVGERAGVDDSDATTGVGAGEDGTGSDDSVTGSPDGNREDDVVTDACGAGEPLRAGVRERILDLDDVRETDRVSVLLSVRDPDTDLLRLLLRDGDTV